MNIKLFIAVIILSFLMIFTSCSNSDNSQGDFDEENSHSVDASNNPEAALDEIYENITIRGVEEADYNYVIDVIGLGDEEFYECYIRKTDGKYGVADVYIIEPAKNNAENVIKALTAFRDKRALEFKDYNIYNSFEIAQKAQIITRGRYVILLMVEDTEGAEEILKKYIPAK